MELDVWMRNVRCAFQKRTDVALIHRRDACFATKPLNSGDQHSVQLKFPVQRYRLTSLDLNVALKMVLKV